MAARRDQASRNHLLRGRGTGRSAPHRSNMPTFLIGKAARARGPFPQEQELLGVRPSDTVLEGGEDGDRLEVSDGHYRQDGRLPY